jgi:hypothetical protein
MPKKDKRVSITWDAETFSRTYGGAAGGYSRAFWESFGGEPTTNPGKFWQSVWQQRIVPAIGNVTGAQRILFVGCGLGLGVERVIDSGFAPSTWGIDSSSYIASLWPTQTRSDIRPKLANHDIRIVTAQQLRTLTGINNVRFTQIITEDMISGYTQPELASTSATVNPLVACENWLAASGKIIHLMMTFGGSTPDMTRWSDRALDPATNYETFAPWAGQPMTNPGSPSMTMAQWQSLRGAPHQFVSMEGL